MRRIGTRGIFPLAWKNPVQQLSGRTTRLVARLDAGEDWSPHGISEIVAHTDDHYLAVNVARRVRDRIRGEILMREFDSRDPGACLAQLGAWLHRIGLESGDDHRVREWSERVAQSIVLGMQSGRSTAAAAS